MIKGINPYKKNFWTEEENGPVINGQLYEHDTDIDLVTTSATDGSLKDTEN